MKKLKKVQKIRAPCVIQGAAAATNPPKPELFLLIQPALLDSI